MDNELEAGFIRRAVKNQNKISGSIIPYFGKDYSPQQVDRI